jgi:hypothetical protein
MVTISFLIILMSCPIRIDASRRAFLHSTRKDNFVIEAPEALIQHTKEFEKQSMF